MSTRLMRRIRESSGDGNDILDEEKRKRFTPDDVNIIYVDQGEAGLVATPIELNEDGEFTTKWPKGFFTERGEELFGS